MTLAVGILGALVALAWSALAIRLIRKSRGADFRFLRPADGLPANLPSVDAIVPARNEADQIGPTLEGLRRQTYPRLAIRVVDDGSTDATPAILARLAGRPGEPPVLAITGSERPEGWVGKTWAVHQGVVGSDAEWLWFVDADMGLHPSALATALVDAEATGADLVSLLPRPRCATFWQGAIACSLLQLLAQLFPLDRVNDPERAEAMAAGGFLLVRRSTYDRAGGHLACRRSITEDIQLARNVKAKGGKLAVRFAPDLAWTHMYGGFGAIWRGLRKNAYAGMDYMPHKYVTGAIVALTLAWAPTLALGLGWAGGRSVLVGIGLAGVLAQLVATAPVARFVGVSPAFGLAVPPGISAYVAIATSGVWHHHRGRILWKDRIMPASMMAGSGDSPLIRKENGTAGR